MPEPDEILVVDDQSANLELLCEILQRAGYKPRPALTGALGLRSAFAKAPALALLDVRMPEIDGFEVCARLKENPKTCDIPVIFISGMSDLEDRVKGLQMGADFISKPFFSGEVLARVGNILAARRLSVENLLIKAGLERQIAERTTAHRKTNRKLVEKIAELELANNDLMETGQRFRIVADNTFDWEYSRGPEGEVLYVSPSCERICGYTQEEISQDPNILQRIVVPEDRSIYTQHRVSAYQKHEFCSREFRITHRNGEIRWIGHICQPVFADDGAFMGIRGSNRDITNQKQTTLLLEESEARYRSLFENMTQGVFYQRADGVLEDVNDAALRMLGLSRDQFLGRTSYDPRWKVIAPDGRELPLEEHGSMVALLTGKRVQDMEIGVYNPPNQDYVWLIVDAVPEFRPGEKEPYRVVVTLQDITPRKLAEVELKRALDELKNSEASLAEAQHISHVGSWDWDMVADKVTWSHELYNLFGIEPGKLDHNPETLLKVIHPDDRDAYIKTMEDNMLRGIENPLEYRVIHPDGSVHTLYAQGMLITDDAGKPVRNKGFAQDITDRKAAEEALRASETRLATIFKNSPIGIAVTDLETGLMVEASPAMLRTLGYSREEALGRTTLELGIWPQPGDRERFKAELLTSGKAAGFEATLINKAGTPIYGKIDAEIVELDGRRVMLSMMEDITVRKNMEKVLLETEKLAGIGTLAAGIAHEINNPLQVVCGISESLVRKAKNREEMSMEDHARRLEMINNNAWRIATIVRALLEYARGSTGRNKPCAVNEIVQSAVKLVEHQFQTAKNILIQLELDP